MSREIEARMFAPACPGINGEWIRTTAQSVMFYDRAEGYAIGSLGSFPLPAVRTAVVRWVKPVGWRIYFPLLVDTRVTESELKQELKRCNCDGDWWDGDHLSDCPRGQSWRAVSVPEAPPWNP